MCLHNQIYNKFQQMDQDITKTVFKRSKMKRMLTSILQDSEMTSEFVVEPSENKFEGLEYQVISKVIDELEPIRQSVEKEQPKSNVSRLEIEIQKHHFDMASYTGQVFFLLIDAFLQGKKSQERGKIMLTNYRVLFFKQSSKRVQIPFGFISKVEYMDKQLRIIYKLKYPHIWRFSIMRPQKYIQFKNIGDIYYKTLGIKKMFAFQYALKLIPVPEPYQFNLQDEYKRMKFDRNHKVNSLIKQQNYGLCFSYPECIYSVKSINLQAIACHRKNKRFPILVYQYIDSHSKIQVPLWIASSYEDLKSINKNSEKELLGLIKCGLKLQVFVAESKNGKTIDEQQFDKQLSVNYLKLETNQELCASQAHLFEVFLANKKPFIKEILNSKWYTYISNLMLSCQMIRNQLLQENSILIRCESGFDKSLSLAALLQIILDPYYRTFKGFQTLVMRMFIHNGHPFAERLGLREGDSFTCPIFLQFLDCVSQLINQNPSSFEFNFKYLARISNLMQTNIYGTFLANSSKQYKQNRIQIETCSIWPDLITPITTNGFYDKKGGILQLTSSLSSIRIWKQHFGDMISRNKDHYGFEQIAQDNDDYLNLYCLRLKQENGELMAKMKQKMATIQKLERQLKEQESHQ